MRKAAAFILAVLAGTTLAFGQQKPFPEASPTKGSVLTITQKDYIPTVNYIPNVVYATKDGAELKLQILMPSMQERKPLPCVVFVQGSAWMKQTLYSNVPQLERFAQRGFVVAMVEYRHTGIAPFPAQAVDAKTAIRYMRMNAKRYNVDPENIFIWGDSSGGHTSLMVALTQDDPTLCDDDMYSEVSCKVNAAVAYYPPTDIAVMKDYPSEQEHNTADSPEGLLIGGKQIDQNIDLAKKASPISYVSKDKDIVPLFLAAGTMDRTVPFSQTDLMVGELQKCGKVYEYYALKGAGHGTWEFWTDGFVNYVEAFIRKYIK